MTKSNESYAYENRYGSASDGGEGKEMFGQFVGPSTKAAVGPSTKDSVGPFDDERFVVWVNHYRNLDISRWDFLTSVGDKLRVAEEKQGEGPTVYQLYAGDDDADSDEIARRATTDLLYFYSLKRLTKGDVFEFQRLVRKARQQFELTAILTQSHFLQRDSSLDSVIGRLPRDMRGSIDHDDVKDFVEGYTRILKDWEETRLYYDYKYFLAECGWITSNTPSVSGLKMLMEDATFLERRFDRIPYARISFDFNYYLGYLCMHEVSGTVEEGKTAYRKRILECLKHLQLSFEKRRKRFPVTFTAPIHFLVFKEREEGYIIRDPVVEVAKIRAFFHTFPLEKHGS